MTTPLGSLGGPDAEDTDAPQEPSCKVIHKEHDNTISAFCLNSVSGATLALVPGLPLPLLPLILHHYKTDPPPRTHYDMGVAKEEVILEPRLGLCRYRTHLLLGALQIQAPFTYKRWYSILQKHCQYKRTLTISACLCAFFQNVLF